MVESHSTAAETMSTTSSAASRSYWPANGLAMIFDYVAPSNRRAVAALVLLSLIALLIQMIGAFVATPAWAAYGPTGLVMPAVLVAIALFLLWYANEAKARSWLS